MTGHSGAESVSSLSAIVTPPCRRLHNTFARTDTSVQDSSVNACGESTRREWTAERKTELGSLWLAGLGGREIAKQLGVTAPAVHTRAGRMELPDARTMTS
ncbi:hypothetical protein EOC94_32450 [Mesorhizobium sp. M6A.T.Ce.TU.016.01.1.1]|nr:hypothetical protein EOC94_32450 [Mesorhizobium sp. M6A.T.Ce.TU.016.01.1.1]